eukprot:jgi/Bigna1/58248/fgenesh1_pm.67_\
MLSKSLAPLANPALSSRLIAVCSPATARRAFSSESKVPEHNFNTICLHGGQEPDPVNGSRIPPICMNTAFVFKDTDDAASKFALQAFGPIYSRIGNPTCDALEGKIAQLEGGMAALAVASGHAAQALAFSNLMMPGDNFVSTNKLYGGSFTQFTQTFPKFGWEARLHDQDDFKAIENAIDSKTKAIYCESIANPGGIITDLEKLSEIAQGAGIPLIVDNTTASPYLVRPFEWGADIVIHSATKFLGGHGNALGGLIVEKGTFDWASQPEKFPHLATPCQSYHGLNFGEVFGKDGPVAEMFGTKGQTGMAFSVGARAMGLRDIGACLSPFNAFLINTGIETLPLRMERHCSNALEVAKYLESHPNVESITYAGLPSNPSYDLSQKYCPKGAGSLFSFKIAGGFDAAKKFVDSVEMLSLVANLGDTRSLIAHPASMMHSQLSGEEQLLAGVEPNSIRLSIGLENVDDIIGDLDKAFKA